MTNTKEIFCRGKSILYDIAGKINILVDKNFFPTRVWVNNYDNTIYKCCDSTTESTEGRKWEPCFSLLEWEITEKQGDKAVLPKCC